MPLLKPTEFTTILSLEELFHTSGPVTSSCSVYFLFLTFHIWQMNVKPIICPSFPLSQSANHFPDHLLTKNSASIVSMISSNFLFCLALTKLSHRLWESFSECYFI